MNDGCVLVVRHGEGRGRLPGYLDAVFARLAATSPALRARLRFHATGAPPPPLDGVRAVVFLLADPLRERYPACYAEAGALAARARAAGARVLNPPEALSHSIKSVQAGRWRSAGVPTPDAVRFESREELTSHVARLGYPIVIRGDALHAQEGIRVCRSARELDAIPEGALRLPGAVSPLVDVRQGFRATAPRGPYARFFHKKRLLVLGDRIRTKHVFFATQPIVSSDSSLFQRAHRWPRLARLVPALRACVREDLAYWGHRQEHAELMRRALAALGLDFAAIDYSTLGDGGVVLWEANPYPFLPAEVDIMLGRWRRAAERVASYHDAVGQLFTDVLEAPTRLSGSSVQRGS